MDLLKSVTGKVVTGAVALAVLAAGISWWQMDPDSRSWLLRSAGRVTAWVAVVLALPWASFFVIARVARLESNGAGAALVLGYTLIEVILLAWLFEWSIAGATAWTFTAAAALLAGVYNLLACDWIAEKLT